MSGEGPMVGNQAGGDDSATLRRCGLQDARREAALPCRARRAGSEVFKLVRIFGRRDTTDHLKRFFALSGTRSSVSKSFVPALAQETHFLVQDFSELKILTKFDG